MKIVGSDELSTELYKLNVSFKLITVTDLFNSCWRYAKRVFTWTVNAIQPIHKKRSKGNSSINYSSINPLNVVNKQ